MFENLADTNDLLQVVDFLASFRGSMFSCLISALSCLSSAFSASSKMTSRSNASRFSRRALADASILLTESCSERDACRRLRKDSYSSLVCHPSFAELGRLDASAFRINQPAETPSATATSRYRVKSDKLLSFQRLSPTEILGNMMKCTFPGHTDRMPQNGLFGRGLRSAYGFRSVTSCVLAWLSRQTIRIFEAITITAPVMTAGNGQSFQIIQPKKVAQIILV